MIVAMRPHGEKGTRGVPKKVDHDERRRGIADALLRLAAAEGLESVSLRSVAVAAGVSMGAVQHYFRSKDDMLAYALQRHAERREQRIVARLTAVGRAPTVREFVRVCALEVLPTDEVSRTEHLVGVAFFIRALREPRMAALIAEGGPKLYAFFAEQLAKAQGAGELAEGVDVYQEALLFWSAVEGQATSVIVGERTAQEAIATIDYHIDRLFLPVRATATL
jgi:AcrR family transcriptional regulator